ncbi:MAG TPA: rod shape-determining protein MreC [Caulobacteraceae bacterium]|nr:rod shape-determining protein MreC [Caulobacteraceae bacterium]
MAYRDGPFENLKVPLGLTAAFAVLVMGAIAVLLIVSDKRDKPQADGFAPVRSGFSRVTAPVSGVFAAPVRWVGHATDFVGDYFGAIDENRRLKKQVAELKAVQDNYVALENINRRYEALLNIRTQPPVDMVAANLVSESRGPFANAQLIDAGTNSRIRVGNPVINEHGLVGRVMGVGPTASRVLMLTDVASRTPVLVDRTDARAILVGDGGANPRLDFLRGTDSVKDGDRIMTSGDGGMLPRGLAVGVAAKALDGTWRVKLYAGNTDTDVVRVLLFDDFSQLLKPDSINAPALAGMNTAPQPSADLVAKIEAVHPAHPVARPAAAAPTPQTQTLTQSQAQSQTSKVAAATATALAPAPDSAAKKKATDASDEKANAKPEHKAAEHKASERKPTKKKPTVKADVIPRRPVPYTAIPQ